MVKKREPIDTLIDVHVWMNSKRGRPALKAWARDCEAHPEGRLRASERSHSTKRARTAGRSRGKH
jgi:hypothetical protein